MSPRANMRRSPWALRAMSDESRKVAARLDLAIIGASPQGPWIVRGVSVNGQVGVEMRGRNVDELVLKASKEITGAD